MRPNQAERKEIKEQLTNCITQILTKGTTTGVAFKFIKNKISENQAKKVTEVATEELTKDRKVLDAITPGFGD